MKTRNDNKIGSERIVMRNFFLSLFAIFLCTLAWANLRAQTGQQIYGPNPLDLTAQIKSPRLESSLHRPLPEQYIWMRTNGEMPVAFWSPTAGAAQRWLYFRRSFDVASVPRVATLYAAGPARIRVYLNGHLIANAQQNPGAKIHPYVLILNVSKSLQAGRNVLALAVAYGRRLVVKIVPAPEAVNAPAILMSGPGWKYSLQEQAGWQNPDFGDTGWESAETHGGIESNINFFQANQDAALYQWPGYDGISPFLARVPVRAAATLDVFPGLGKFHGLSALSTKGNQLMAAPSSDFAVDLPSSAALPDEYPSLVLDFGRESTGRLKVVSDSDAPTRIAIQYGESLGEAINDPYLGVDDLVVPPHATVYGPKSAFRYAEVRFLAGPSPMRFKTIELDDIYYPVHYRGSFDSSDALLNRIWLVGAYTAHLCMQDDIWDAPKRDRARWMGDLDVSGHVIDDVFADRFLMQQTMDQLIHDAGDPVDNEVNHIPGYSAFWIMGEADYYQYIGNKAYLESIHQPLVQLLSYMEGDLNSQNLFTNLNGRMIWPFVDWSPGLSPWPSFLGSGKPLPIQETAPNAQRATEFEYYAAFKEGAWLLRQLGDTSNADRFASEAKVIRQASLQYMLNRRTGTFGDRWQPNAMAIYSGLADKSETQTIWQKVLSHPDKFRITPYYNYYVIAAMAAAGHEEAALNWIRKYWGGMIRRGATSFWEAYFLGLPKHKYHHDLRADYGQGDFVSLAHGWSTGPTVWLTEEILGIRPTAPGFSQVLIRPDLAGLQWARGTEPTPRGIIKVNYHPASGSGLVATIDLPSGTQADVSMPVSEGQKMVQVNGREEIGTLAQGGRRSVIHIQQPGHYVLKSQ